MKSSVLPQSSGMSLSTVPVTAAYVKPLSVSRLFVVCTPNGDVVVAMVREPTRLMTSSSRAMLVCLVYGLVT